MTTTGHDAVTGFWRGRTSVVGPRATRFHGEHDAYDLAAITRCAPDRTPVRVLDLGCGTCVIPSALVSELGWRIHAVDFIPEFLAEAIDDPRLTTEVGDVRTYEDRGGYDLILSLGVITCLLDEADRQGMYERCARMLGPGGTLFCKAQFGVDREINIDKFSEALGAEYRAVYPRLSAEVSRIASVFSEVEVIDPFGPELNPYPDTHFHYVVARRPHSTLRAPEL
jgi:trans-aconitate methyltransferase